MKRKINFLNVVVVFLLLAIFGLNANIKIILQQRGGLNDRRFISNFSRDSVKSKHDSMMSDKVEYLMRKVDSIMTKGHR